MTNQAELDDVIGGRELPAFIWAIRHCARYAGLSQQTYRRKWLTHPRHPLPLDLEATPLEFHANEVREFWNDPEAMRASD